MEPEHSFFNRLVSSHAKAEPASETPADVNGEAADDAGTWGWLRGVRDRAQMVELRRRDGNVLAVSYGWLDRVEYDPSDGITLHVAGRQIVISGQHLDAEARPNLRLFTALCRHRALWIAESERRDKLAPKAGAMVIDSIRW